MHLWFDPSTASNALRIEATGQRYKKTTEFVYSTLVVLSARARTSTPRLSVALAPLGRMSEYNSQLYDRRNAQLLLKIRLFKAEVVEAMLYGCATWTMRSQDFDSLRTAHHKLLLRVIGFRRKDRTGYKPLERLSRGSVPNASKR